MRTSKRGALCLGTLVALLAASFSGGAGLTDSAAARTQTGGLQAPPPCPPGSHPKHGKCVCKGAMR
jgi:hypothetical protein